MVCTHFAPIGVGEPIWQPEFARPFRKRPSIPFVGESVSGLILVCLEGNSYRLRSREPRRDRGTVSGRYSNVRDWAGRFKYAMKIVCCGTQPTSCHPCSCTNTSFPVNRLLGEKSASSCEIVLDMSIGFRCNSPRTDARRGDASLWKRMAFHPRDLASRSAYPLSRAEDRS
jgi:hypothetical protein